MIGRKIEDRRDRREGQNYFGKKMIGKKMEQEEKPLAEMIGGRKINSE